jgi:nucleotide-binding universal stress UspA family protein
MRDQQMEKIMFKNLLVPISDDALTKSELKAVIKLAKTDSAKITLVYVSDPVAPYSSSEIDSVLAMTEKEHKKYCEQFAAKVFFKAQKLIGSQIKAGQMHVYHSNISDGIIEAAKKIKADVIVMSSHKRTGIKGLFLRSEAHEVILHSSIPVLILN